MMSNRMNSGDFEYRDRSDLGQVCGSRSCLGKKVFSAHPKVAAVARYTRFDAGDEQVQDVKSDEEDHARKRQD